MSISSGNKTSGVGRGSDESRGRVSFAGAAKNVLLGVSFLLFLPVMWGVFVTDANERSQFENRTLASAPAITQLSEPRLFFSQLNKYVQDHVGFAVKTNQFYRGFAFSLFSESTVPNITVVEDGFVFLTSHFVDQRNVIFDQLCQPEYDPAVLEEYFVNLKKINDIVTSFGHRMIFATTATKPVLYPERLPLDISGEVRERCIKFSKSENIIIALQAKAEDYNIIFHYPLQEFVLARDEPHFYPKENFHWNGSSAHLFSKLLFERLGVAVGENYDRGRRLVKAEADLKMLGFERLIEVWDYPYANYELQGGFKNKALDYMKRYYSHLLDYSYYSAKRPMQDKDAIVISDSFGGPLARHLAPGYKTLAHFNVSQLQDVEKKRFYNYILRSGDNMDFIFMFHDGTVLNGSTLKNLSTTFANLNTPTIITYAGKQLPGLVGKVENESRVARSPGDPAGVLSFGPYLSLAAGKYRITISYSGRADNGDIVGRWDVGRFDEYPVTLKVGDFKSSRQSTSFTVFIPASGINQFEIRTFFGGKGELVVESIIIEEL